LDKQTLSARYGTESRVNGNLPCVHTSTVKKKTLLPLSSPPLQPSSFSYPVLLGLFFIALTSRRFLVAGSIVGFLSVRGWD
jgi:hypothetical protein